MKKKIILLILSISCVLGIVIGLNHVKADSGWDSDYDSTYHGGNYYSHGSGDNSGGSIESLIILTIIIVIIIYAVRSSAKKNNNTAVKLSSNYSDVSDDILNKYGIEKESFKKMAYEKYLAIQDAWMNFEYDKLKKYLTDELYNSYTMQLDALKVKKQKNIMNNFSCLDTKITEVTEENNLLNVTVYLRVSMYDYVVDKDNTVLRGSNNHKIDIEYMLTFVKTKHNDDKDVICPNCGAKIEAVASGKCEYCGAVVVVDAKDYVMSRKTNIGQRRM